VNDYYSYKLPDTNCEHGFHIPEVDIPHAIMLTNAEQTMNLSKYLKIYKLAIHSFHFNCIFFLNDLNYMLALKAKKVKNTKNAPLHLPIHALRSR